MWFKQVQIFQLTNPIQATPSALAEKLEPFEFNPCLPSMALSMGWVSPLDEDEAPLTRGINGCVLICLQIEDKILPASVVNQTLKDKIKQIELNEARRVRRKEKLTFKDEVMITLLPRAFTKLTRLYAYIDTRNQWLVLNTTSAARTDLFLTMFKKAFGEGITTHEVVKPSSIMTTWLKNKDYPQDFAIEKSCVLQDPDQQTRVIRCQQQNLFDASIQSLVKDGCAVVQMAMSWHDKINFVLAEDFSLKSIRLSDVDMSDIQDELETGQQKLDADLMLMSEMLAGLINALLEIFAKQNDAAATNKLAMVG